MSSAKNRYSNTEPEVPDCQDWTTVTLSKPKSKTQQPATQKTANTSSVNSASAVVAATASSKTGGSGGGGIGDDDTKKTKYIAKATSDAVRTARCEKKLTQKELAQKCNMDVSIIAEIERGGNCVYNAGHVNKIQSVLGVKIPRA
jgi:ribosome-binding protein aMBF1 (putative translation factor)